jgi:hypothetical protein
MSLCHVPGRLQRPVLGEATVASSAPRHAGVRNRHRVLPHLALAGPRLMRSIRWEKESGMREKKQEICFVTDMRISHDIKGIIPQSAGARTPYSLQFRFLNPYY